MSEKDIIFSKIDIVKTCLTAIERVTRDEKYEVFRQGLYELNLQRAIQACIDMAHTVIAKEGLKLPNSYRQAFEILANEQIVPKDLATIMVKMVGFRNISVHDYSTIKGELVEAIVKSHLGDFEKFIQTIYDRVNQKWT